MLVGPWAPLARAVPEKEMESTSIGTLLSRELIQNEIEISGRNHGVTHVEPTYLDDRGDRRWLQQRDCPQMKPVIIQHTMPRVARTTLLYCLRNPCSPPRGEMGWSRVHVQ